MKYKLEYETTSEGFDLLRALRQLRLRKTRKWKKKHER